MNAPEHLIISGPEDILGYVPHTLGYWPSCSLVAMTMQGKRLGATLRVDLPTGTPSPCRREDFARTVADYLLADKEADGTLLELVERDLQLRGPGDFFGTRQSGLPTLRVGDLLRDHQLMEEARREAVAALDDPAQTAALAAFVSASWEQRFGLVGIG